ncbi:hypothetical protein Y032_0125g1291 [Ancylostoma ceylanicum]|uniref:Uncharacterized protein n=1 Tax=Ancylostoma ceylanicum TaxID=53326 RepID=A0A016T8Z3_9BILA|nr:hypothetical protein Y032_0125g1291 [Ancylostoma ceylanicum]
MSGSNRLLRLTSGLVVCRPVGRSVDPVSYIIFCPYKILPTIRNSPHRTHYVRLRNLCSSWWEIFTGKEKLM